MTSPLLSLLASGAAAVAPTEAPDVPDWISFYGDLRLRAESTFDQANGEDRHRGRMRFRAGATFQISDELKAEVRLATYSGEDARNAHWDFGDDDGVDTLSGARVQLDRLNLAWAAAEGVTLKAGKMGAPLATNPVYSEWVWDGDIQPTGVAGIWELDRDMDLDVRFGHFIVDEVNVRLDESATPSVIPGSTTDQALTVLQLNLGDATDSFDWDVSTALWEWNAEGADDYRIWDTILAATMDDLVASFQYVQNLEDDTGEDTGMVLGLQFGKGGSAGDRQVFGSFYDFDGMASNWAVGQDDVPIAVDPTEGLTGFVGGLKYWWTDTVTFKLWALTGDDGTEDPLRLRFDIDVKLKR